MVTFIQHNLLSGIIEEDCQYEQPFKALEEIMAATHTAFRPAPEARFLKIFVDRHIFQL